MGFLTLRPTLLPRCHDFALFSVAHHLGLIPPTVSTADSQEGKSTGGDVHGGSFCIRDVHRMRGRSLGGHHLVQMPSPGHNIVPKGQDNLTNVCAGP